MLPTGPLHQPSHAPSQAPITSGAYSVPSRKKGRNALTQSAAGNTRDAVADILFAVQLFEQLQSRGDTRQSFCPTSKVGGVRRTFFPVGGRKGRRPLPGRTMTGRARRF